MKKRIFCPLTGSLLVVLFLLCTPSFQLKSQSFSAGDKDLNLGIGFGATWYHGIGFSTTLPPVSVSLDYGFRDDIGPGVLSIGGLIGIASYKSRYFLTGYYDYGYKYTSIVGAARGTYHYEIIEDFDTYGAVMLGLRLNQGKLYGETQYFNVDEKDSNTDLVFSLLVGGKYYFTEKIAVFGEVGYSIAWFTVGLTTKL